MSSACTTGFARDLNVMCDTTQRFYTQPVAPPHMFEAYTRWIEAEGLSPEAMATWRELSALPPDQRYAHLQSAAAQNGVDGWSCPDLEKMLRPR